MSQESRHLLFDFQCPCDANAKHLDFAIPHTCKQSQAFSFVGYDGESGVIRIEAWNEITFEDGQDGESARAALLLDSDILAADDGEHGSASILADSIIRAIAHDGDAGESELKTIATARIDAPLYDGDNTSISLIRSIIVDGSVYDGDATSIDKLEYPKTVKIDDATAHDGENTSISLDTIKPLLSDGSVADGESGRIASIVFAAYARLALGAYDGDGTIVDLFVPPAKNKLDLQAHDGETASATIEKSKRNPFEKSSFLGYEGERGVASSASFAVFSFGADDGSSVTTTEFFKDEGSLWRVHDGEYTPLTPLNIHSKLWPRDAYDGDRAEIIIKEKPPERLDGTIYDGDGTWMTLERLLHVKLRPYNATDGELAQFSFDDTNMDSTIFSLCRACAPWIACQTVIQYERGVPPWEYSSDLAEKTEMILALENRLYLNGHDGEQATGFLFEVNNSLGHFYGYDGELMKSDIWRDKGLDFDSTVTQPDGGKTDIDLSQDDPRAQDANNARDGEYSIALLATIQSCYPFGLDGENTEVALDIFKWPKAYDGENTAMILATTVWLIPHEAPDGEEGGQELPDPPLQAYDGESTSAILEMIFETYFKETGCVDNEYIPRDERGEPDYKNATTAAIEFERFEYSLKGGCR
jgi:hypothetical protein|nr:MAG TPA: hypothetical protein [Caudoviricetes sp.]